MAKYFNMKDDIFQKIQDFITAKPLNKMLSFADML
jgi:hypothetical protein